MTELLTQGPWPSQLGLIVSGLILGFLVEKVLVRWFRWMSRRTETKWDDLVVDSIHNMPLVWFTTLGVWGALTLGGTPLVVKQFATRMLPLVMVGSLIIVGMRLAGGAVENLARRNAHALGSTTLVTNLARLLVAILGTVIILQNLNVQITPLLTALGVGGLAVALALQDTLGNLFAGVQIIVSRQVRPHDYVKLATGEEGYVTDVKGRNTTIRTFPNHNMVIVPNGVLASSIVTNYSLPRRNLWIQIGVGVSYDSDLAYVEKVTLEVAAEVLGSVEGGVQSADPKVRFTRFGDSSIDFQVQLFVSEFTDQFLIRHEFIKRLHERFGQEGIEIPFPIRTLHMPTERPLPDVLGLSGAEGADGSGDLVSS